MIKVEACAICKTDVKMFHAGHRDLELPRVLGHEVAGTIVEVGEEVEDKFEEASLAEPLACCINAQTLCRISPGDTVAIIGAGPIGHLNAQLARIFGASEIIVIEKSLQRIEFTEKNNIADVFINPGESDPMEAIREETNNSGVDVVIPACSVPEVPVQGIKMLNKRGRIVFFSGLPYGYGNISPDHNLVHYKEIKIFGAYGCTSEQNREAVRLLSAGRINVKYLITHCISLDKLTKGFELIDTHKAMEVVVASF